MDWRLCKLLRGWRAGGSDVRERKKGDIRMGEVDIVKTDILRRTRGARERFEHLHGSLGPMDRQGNFAKLPAEAEVQMSTVCARALVGDVN